MSEPDRETYEAAERLVREAQTRAEEAARAAADSIPPNGWRAGGERPGEPGPGAFPDVTALLAVIESMRGAIPPELARQLTDALRDLLIAIRAVLDYSIERLERPARDEREVEDIPIR
jgi:hypothetical protein